jgi:hypothetical protein
MSTYCITLLQRKKADQPAPFRGGRAVLHLVAKNMISRVLLLSDYGATELLPLPHNC